LDDGWRLHIRFIMMGSRLASATEVSP